MLRSAFNSHKNSPHPKPFTIMQPSIPKRQIDSNPKQKLHHLSGRERSLLSAPSDREIHFESTIIRRFRPTFRVFSDRPQPPQVRWPPKRAQLPSNRPVRRTRTRASQPMFAAPTLMPPEVRLLYGRNGARF